MVYTLGESLLDIIINSIDDTIVRPGGAMLNAAISLGRSKIEVSLVTELGDDQTAKLITSFLKNNNVSSKYIKLYNNNDTSLALAFLDENKKPSYTFIKNYPLERDLKIVSKFYPEDILLFGSLYSLDKQIRNSVLAIANNASKSNATIIYDPNIRHAHHLKDDKLMNAIFENIKLSNIVKGSDEDFTNIFGISNTQAILGEIRKINKEALIIITLGADGIMADIAGQTTKLPTIKTNVISTIGAGDAFNAGIIYALTKSNLTNNELSKMTVHQLRDILKSGLQFSAKVCASIDNYIPNYITS